MADGTKIEWTDATWNPITGCSVVSPGCTNCYAMKLAGTRLKHSPSRVGLTKVTKAGPVWNGDVRFNEATLDQPLRWRRPRMIFVCAHGDLFAEGVPDEWIDRVFAVMALAPQHTFQVLTKRAERMRSYLADQATNYRVAHTAYQSWQWKRSALETSDHDEWVEIERDGVRNRLHGRLAVWPLPNVWLGVSAEDQKRADERVPLLLATTAAVRWVSAEPLLGPIDFHRINEASGFYFDALSRKVGISFRGVGIDWIVAGGESGTGARPMHPDWVRSIRDQCAAAGVAFLFKQWGQHLPAGQIDGDGRLWNGRHEDGRLAYLHSTKKIAGRTLDGVTHDAFPAVRHG